MGAKPPGRIEPKIFLEEGIRDVITCFKFGDDRFRGLASAEGQILPFPIDFDGRPYNTLTLPCERVISRGHVVKTTDLLCISNAFFSKYVFLQSILCSLLTTVEHG